MADAPEIKVKLTAEDTGVAAAIKELGNQLKGLKKNQDDVASSASGMAEAFKGLVAVIAVERLLTFSKEVINAGASLARTTQITGASTQTLSVFAKTADDLGVSSEAVDKGFVKLSRSILSFQQGGAEARQAFAQLNISQKDFIGLNSDQKIRLVTDRLGQMADGTQKAALAQQLLGRGGAELIPVFNELAGEGFDKARESAEKLGLLIDGDTAESFKQLKKSLTEVADAGKGIATQFTAGLAPALIDVGNAIVKATTQDGVGGFRKLGEEAGKIFKDVTLVVVGFTDTIIRNFGKAFDDVRDIGKAIGDVFTIGFSAANKKLGESLKSDYAALDAELDSREQKIFQELDGTSRLQEAQDDKNNKNNRDTKPPAPPIDEGAAFAGLKRQQQQDAFAAAQVSALQRQLQDELAIFKSYEKQREQTEKDSYDHGRLSTDEYYERRKADLKTETDQELAILTAQLKAAQEAADRSAQERAANSAKAKQFGADTRVGQAYTAAAAKNDQEHIANLTKIDELQTKISTTTIDGQTKAAALDDSEFKAKQENQQKTLEFEKQLADLQGKRQDTARAEIEAEAQKRSLQIQQSGGSNADKARLTAELEQWKRLKLAVADYEAAREKTKEDTQSFDIQKQGIEIQQKAGQITPLEAEQRINQLIKDRLPLLQADAAAELAAAQKTGNSENVANTQNTIQQLGNLGVASNKLGEQVGQGLNADFTHFFETVGRGTQSVAQSFQNLAASVIGSIEQILIKLLLLKIAQSAAAAAGGGSGFLNSIFTGLGGGQGHAGGGLIKGPGGPKSDSIPARLSDGEYVVQSDAVKAFGVHNLEAINRGLKIPSIANLSLPKFAEGGLVGNVGGGDSSINLGIGLDEGLILRQLSSKAAGNIVIQHLANNPKAAGKALSRSQ